MKSIPDLGTRSEGEDRGEAEDLPALLPWLTLLSLALSGCQDSFERKPPEPAIRAVAEIVADVPVALAPGEVHYREYELEAGDFLQALVDQRGIDVVLRFLDPRGDELLQIDSPNGRNGFEELVSIAPSAGRYRLEVVAPDSDSPRGHYAVEIVGPRPATPEDRELTSADDAFRSARSHFGKSVFGKAIGDYERALEVFSRLGPSRREIDALHGLCRGYRELEEWRIAVAFCDRALETYRIQEDRRGLDVLLDRTGWLRLQLGQIEPARALYEEALALFEARGHPKGAALTLSRLGRIHHAAGRIQSALDSLDQALARIEGVSDAESEAAIRHDMGNVLLDLGRHGEAFRQYSRALEVYRRLGDRGECSKLLARMAFAAVRQGDFGQAESSITEALRLEDEGAGEAATHSIWGTVLLLRGDPAGARRAVDKALELARRRGDVHTEAMILTQLAHLDVETGQGESGLSRADQAREIFARIAYPRGEATARVRAAEALRSLGRPEEAWNRMEPALGILEGLRATTERRDFRMSNFAFYQEFYESAVDVLMRLHRQAPAHGWDTLAFEVQERRLARELTERLEERRALLQEAVPSHLISEERRLERHLADAALAPRGTAGRQEKIDELIAGLERVRVQIRRAGRDAGAQSPLEGLSVDALREEVLDEETLLLAYSLGSRVSYLFALSRRGLDAYELPPRPEIELLAHHFAGRLARPDRRSQDLAVRLGRNLGEALLGPVAPRLGDFSRLVLVAEGALLSIPFAAIASPADGKPLVHTHETVVAPSAGALALSRRARASRPAPDAGVLLVGDPVYSDDDPRLGGLVEEASGPSAPADDVYRDLRRSAEELETDPFERLPFSGDEVEKIRDLYGGGGDVVLARGFEADRDLLASRELHRYGRLHFATHALVNAERPELSGLVFSLVDGNGQARNGFVRAFEISRLDLRAELVVLSACETGLGKNVRGEGPQSLSRAFLDAGAVRVVYSLWKVSDRSTAELMIGFHEALKDGHSPAAALRRVQLSMLAQPRAQPFQWAGFVLIGEWRGEPESIGP